MAIIRELEWRTAERGYQCPWQVRPRASKVACGILAGYRALRVGVRLAGAQPCDELFTPEGVQRL